MANHLNRDVGSMEYDKLFADLRPQAHVGSGIIRRLGAAATYVRGTVLAKSSADNMLVILGTDAAVSSQAFNGDGSDTTFAITAKPMVVNSVKVGGSAVTISSYDATTGVVTLAAAPASGTGNVIAYYNEEILTPDCVLCDDTSVGTSADVNAAVYTAGNFNVNALTVNSGYTMTESDKDKLRERGIYLGVVWPI